MKISTQGLIRLTYDVLSTISLSHLISGIDTNGSDDDCGRPTELTGFTEWVTQTTPAITIGWDWKIEFKNGQSRYERLGLPRSNVMLINDHGLDHGWGHNLDDLARFVDSMPWPSVVDEAIKFRNIA